MVGMVGGCVVIVVVLGRVDFWLWCRMLVVWFWLGLLSVLWVVRVRLLVLV